MAEDDYKTELIAELSRARTSMAGNVSALRRDLDFPTRARKAFTRSPLPWLGGAALVGLIVARFPKRTKKVVTVFPKKEPPLEQAGKAGLLLGALKIAFDFARPALLKWATQRFSDYVSTAQTRNSHRS